MNVDVNLDAGIYLELLLFCHLDQLVLHQMLGENSTDHPELIPYFPSQLSVLVL